MSYVADRLALALVAVGLSASALAGTAHVTFVNPENFTDIGRYAPSRDSEENLTEIARHIGQLAEHRLSPDQTVDIEVPDVQLAGRLEYRDLWPREVRVILPVTWPSIKLRYRLKQGQQVLASGEELVSDMEYLHRVNAYPTSDPRRYEKLMLDDWFEHRLVERQPPLR
jgi:hypothetical protein